MPFPILLIHGYSAESKTADLADITAIYGELPRRLRATYGQANVFELDVSRYLSLDDSITLDDIAFALDRALRTDYRRLLDHKFRVVIHSTGALVIRNWIRRFSLQYPNHPLDRVIYLAGALSGSGWAHIGAGRLAKWGRWVFDDWSERGVRVLEGLELASEWTLELHRSFLDPVYSMISDYGVREAAIIGSSPDPSWYETPIPYAKEDGSDGVVRVAAGNPNLAYMQITPKDVRDVPWEVVCNLDSEDKACDFRQIAHAYTAREVAVPGDTNHPLIPMAIAFNRAHSRATGIVQQVTDQVLRLITLALDSGDKDWDSVARAYAEATADTYQQVKTAKTSKKRGAEEPSQYDGHAQIVFRVRDQDGRPVRNFDIFFQNAAAEIADGRALRIGELFEDKHVNRLSPYCICFYLRLTRWDQKLKDWEDRLALTKGCFLEISATEPTDKIRFLPVQVPLEMKTLRRWLRPHETTIVDVVMLRLPAPEVFTVRTTL